MAIDVNKPVYVFDQERNKWYTKLDEDWIEIGTPTLTPNFAGIGTRNINQNGIEAIRDVYENTFREDENIDSYKTYSGMITELEPNQVFVFGSNTQGRHGKGAALMAR
jgi:hypothetical protein